MTDSIYDGNAPRTRPFEGGTTSLWEPVPAEPGLLTTGVVMAAQARPVGSLDPELEAALLATLMRPTAAGETSAAGNARREVELRALIDRLSVMEAFALGRRIDLEKADDALAQAFKRLVVERRVRLRAYVADARRRAALRGG